MATIQVSTTNERVYRDLDLSFTIHPIRKDINVFLKEKAIINSVKNLVITNHYERLFQPEVGCNIRRLLFENVDPLVAAQIEREIEETITNFEPRVKISRVTAIPSPDENKYNMEMEFYIINNSNPITIKFFLERIR